MGAHVVPLTPAGKIILVKLRYEHGWSLPGGSRKRGETALQNALRELREEIGVLQHGEPVQIPYERVGGSDVFLVPDVIYKPRWSIEVDAVMETDPAELPTNMTNQALIWIDAAF